MEFPLIRLRVKSSTNALVGYEGTDKLVLFPLIRLRVKSSTLRDTLPKRIDFSFH